MPNGSRILTKALVTEIGSVRLKTILGMISAIGIHNANRLTFLKKRVIGRKSHLLKKLEKVATLILLIVYEAVFG